MNVDGLGWNWSVVTPPALVGAAEVELAPNSTLDPPAQPPPTSTDSRAKVDALEHTAPQSVQIQALQDQSRPFALATPGLSDLTIDLGDPEVIESWPNCTSACVNAGIGARFNREMMVDGFIDGNIRLYRCASESCYKDPAGSGNLVPASTTIGAEGFRVSLNVPPHAQEPTIITASPAPDLLPNTWYQAEITSIYAIGGYDRRGDSPIALVGEPAKQYIWKFKTKDDASLCAVSEVRVEPDPFTAYTVGEKTAYSAIPLGAPDACNPVGQRLSEEDYGWSWSTADQSVATVTNFTSVGQLKPYCSAACLPRGSDVSREETVPVPLCGNGLVEVGEDCDIGGNVEVDLDINNAPLVPLTAYAANQIGQAERAGISCTFSCLRPGNPDTATCGNNNLEPLLGEECDPGQLRSHELIALAIVRTLVRRSNRSGR